MAKTEPVLEFVSAKDVKVRPVKWLWPFLYPRERLLFVKKSGRWQGDILLILAVYMSHGKPLPFTDYESVL